MVMCQMCCGNGHFWLCHRGLKDDERAIRWVCLLFFLDVLFYHLQRGEGAYICFATACFETSFGAFDF